MAQQIYIAPLVCVTDGGGMTTCAPKVDSTVVNYSAACQKPTDPTPKCLVLAVGDLTSANNDNSLVALIGDNFDTPTSSVSNAVRNRINNGLTNQGVTLTRVVYTNPNDPATGVVTPATFTDYPTVREFITAVGKWFDPNFDLSTFWVFGATRQAKH